jgi:quinoprotein glucose dehydrogenase
MGSATGEGYMSAPGDLRAYDVLTGKIGWTFHTIPQPGEFGYDTWPKGAHSYVGGANTWGEITVDEKRGIAYFPTGSSTYDFYGADRAGSNLFANCLLALDARTGKYLWHFQLVHHDLWDYDATAAPQLITVRHNGKQIDAVAQAGKNGFLFAFDRVSGKPLWPIEERPVPKSDVPGEQTSPTQPFPTAPPPFARQKMTADDVNPYLLSPVERANLKDRIASAQGGLFTPPSLKLETVALPGARGGANWGGTAANAAKGLMYLVTQDWPTIYKLSLEDPLKGRVRPAAARAPGQQGRALYEERCQACHGPNGAGSALGPPKLAGVNTRLAFDAFRQVVLAGKAQMPAFPDVDNTALTAMFAFLSDPAGESPATRLKNGPVVASGGAPGGLEIAPRTANRYSPLDGPPYPPGLGTPPNRYFTNWGLYPDQPYVIGPPWSAIVAYDLNKGTIKWKMPLGEDTLAASQGAKDAGIIKGEHHGIIVTSTGLIFVNATDGKVRAYDEDNGKVLWTATLPAGSEGVPSMYEVNGQQYLVVSASSNITPGGGYGGLPAATASLRRGYVAFALPTKANASK